MQKIIPYHSVDWSRENNQISREDPRFVQYLGSQQCARRLGPCDMAIAVLHCLRIRISHSIGAMGKYGKKNMCVYIYICGVP